MYWRGCDTYIKTNIEKKSDQGKKASRISVLAISFAIFSISFFFGPFRLLDKMKYIPGDLGNAQKFGFALQSIQIK